MKARSIMTVNVTCIAPTESLERAWALLRKLRARHLPVVEQGERLVGILSDRDLLVEARREGEGFAFPEKTVAEVMTREVVTCAPGATTSAMAALMLDKKIDALPITSPDGQLRGLVTSSDLLALLLEVEAARAPLPFEFQVEVAGVLAAAS